MKKIQKVLSLAFVATAMIACTSSNKENKMTGVIVDASMNNVVIENNGKTIAFTTMDADKSQVNGIAIGDTATLTYKGAIEDGKVVVATKLEVKPAARQAEKDVIIGAWIEPIEGQDGVQGIEFKEDGTAASINMSTLVYEKWSKNGDVVVLGGKSIGNGQTIEFSDTLNVVKNDADSLVLNNATKTLRYAKQK